MIYQQQIEGHRNIERAKTTAADQTDNNQSTRHCYAYERCLCFASSMHPKNHTRSSRKSNRSPVCEKWKINIHTHGPKQMPRTFRPQNQYHLHHCSAVLNVSAQMICSLFAATHPYSCCIRALFRRSWLIQIFSGRAVFCMLRPKEFRLFRTLWPPVCVLYCTCPMDWMELLMCRRAAFHPLPAAARYTFALFFFNPPPPRAFVSLFAATCVKRDAIRTNILVNFNIIQYFVSLHRNHIFICCCFALRWVEVRWVPCIHEPIRLTRSRPVY